MIVVSILRLLAISISCLTISAIPQFQEPILIVVGDVNTNNARIMYDALDRHLVHTPVQAVLSLSGEDIYSETLIIAEKPSIWILSSLEPGQHYLIHLSSKNGISSRASFSTLSSNRDSSFKIVIASCNNFDSDHDGSFLKQLSEDENVQSRIGMMHIGDQIYADPIFHNWNRGGRLKPFEVLLEEFRSAYRRVWSAPEMRTLLSTAANWMLLDDHDIINNLDAEHFRDGRGPLLLAGRQALLEYQFQLHRDVFHENGTELSQVCADFNKVISSFAFIFVDTRFQRTFSFDGNAPMLGKAQMHRVNTSIHRYGQDTSISRMFVVSSVPFMFAPFKWFATLADIVEGEKLTSHSVHRRETSTLLDLVGKFANKSTFLAGDVHLFLRSRICQKATSHATSSRHCIEQIVTSGVTVASTAANQLKVCIFHFMCLFLGPRQLGSWELVPDAVNIGHNALIVNGQSENYEAIPIFYKSPSQWTQASQNVFNLGFRIRAWQTNAIVLTAVSVMVTTLIYRIRRNSKRKTHN
uniref:PhoD-like phosphatase metallophosphatase domain-containing protein n=1 Tax=Spongospora subterranea TaxID=70186 RepID=A0A0H5RF39_9EUKA|eukprot:CRZ07249.1 hypothetical protein [Spongospora subterranea]